MATSRQSIVYVAALCVAALLMPRGIAGQSLNTCSNVVGSARRATVASWGRGDTLLGAVGMGHNLDVLCLNVTGAPPGTVIYVYYTDGTYPITSIPQRVVGSGAMEVVWSAVMTVPQDAVVTATPITIDIGAVASNPPTTSLASDATKFIERIDYSASAKSGEDVLLPLPHGARVTFNYLSLFTKPLDPLQLTNCFQSTAPQPYRLDLLSGPNCIYSNGDNACCKQTAAEGCAQVGTGSCMWVKLQGQCLPIHDTTDLRGVVGTAQSDATTFTYFARRPFGNTSTFQTGSSLRWAVRYRHDNPVGCNVHVDLTAVVQTGSVVCEAAMMDVCDARAAECVAASPRTDRRYCDCMKATEQCYRLSGCARNRNYERHARDCIENGCGDYCSAGVATVASAAVAAVLMLLVLML